MRVPNLIVAGVLKGGTTSVFSYLSRHPSVCVSSVKETCYFHGAKYGVPLDPLESYRCVFSHCAGEPYVMEATPGYFDGGRPVAEAIRALLGSEVRILLVLREPTERLLSFFNFSKSMLALPKDADLCTYVKQCQGMPVEERRRRANSTYFALDVGMYDQFLPDWIDVFDNSLKVMFFDDLKEDPRGFLGEICTWLDIDPQVYDGFTFERENRSVSYRSKALQAVALKINATGQVFWRRNPGLKVWLRRLYQAMNGKAFEREGNLECLKALHDLYQGPNARTAAILRAAGYQHLPAWLVQAEAVDRQGRNEAPAVELESAV